MCLQCLGENSEKGFDLKMFCPLKLNKSIKYILEDLQEFHDIQPNDKDVYLDSYEKENFLS